MKKSVLILSIATLCIIGLLALFFRDLAMYAKTPAGTSATEQVVTVASGQGFENTTEALTHAGVIRRPLKFKILARVTGKDHKIKAGEYLLSADMSPEMILETLVRGKALLHRITIPEGYNLRQIAATVEKAGLVPGSEFMSAATDAAFAKKFGIPGLTFEGYLFPDTYHFLKTASPEKIISTMVKRFQSVFPALWEKRPPDFPLTMHETVTLASIIEKETGAANERSLISSVFHNRLAKKMRLESDPTVIYGIENFDGNLTRKHLRTRTAYNTYTIAGLPPGPIASPGFESLKAAIFPENSAFLFFVSKNDGTHQFSTTYSAHSRAVRKYQLGK